MRGPVGRCTVWPQDGAKSWDLSCTKTAMNLLSIITTSFFPSFVSTLFFLSHPICSLNQSKHPPLVPQTVGTKKHQLNSRVSSEGEHDSHTCTRTRTHSQVKPIRTRVGVSRGEAGGRRAELPGPGRHTVGRPSPGCGLWF